LVKLTKPDGTELVKEGSGDFVAEVTGEYTGGPVKSRPKQEQPRMAPEPEVISEVAFPEDEPVPESVQTFPDPATLESIDKPDEPTPVSAEMPTAPEGARPAPSFSEIQEKRRKAEMERRVKEKKRKELDKKKAAAAKIHYEKGMDFFKRGEWGKATKRFAKAEELQPEESRYLAYRAYSDFARSKDPNNLKKTINDLKTAIELDHDSAEPWFLIGMSHKIIGEKSKAIIYFKKALEIDEAHTDSLREVRLFNMAKDKEKEPSSFWTLSIGGKKKP
jgi:hypothetical protein